VATGPFSYDDGYIYAVGDGVKGYDMVASRMKSAVPQCVVRIKADADEFDSDFFLDLQEITKSPAIYTLYPMPDHKLLVNLWSPDVDVTQYEKSDMPSWFWEANPYYEYAIVDMNTKESTKVEDLPRAATSSVKTLYVDSQNYVQIFREDKGSTLYRVDTDGKVTKVLENPSAANVQYLGRP
jgi:hypothetical protein